MELIKSKNDLIELLRHINTLSLKVDDKNTHLELAIAISCLSSIFPI